MGLFFRGAMYNGKFIRLDPVAAGWGVGRVFCSLFLCLSALCNALSCSSFACESQGFFTRIWSRPKHNKSFFSRYLSLAGQKSFSSPRLINLFRLLPFLMVQVSHAFYCAGQNNLCNAHRGQQQMDFLLLLHD